MAQYVDIKRLRKGLDITQSEIGSIIGQSQNKVSEIENGKRPYKPEYTMLLSERLGDISEYITDGIRPPEPSTGNKIPFYDDVISIGGHNGEDAVTNAVSSPTEWIDTGDWFKNATAAIRHYGDSMVEYPQGCILAIKEVQNRELIVYGRDYVIETSEYRVTKRVQKGSSSRYITAYSTNQETYKDGRMIHEPFEIPVDAITHISLILGYVVKKNGGTTIYSATKE